MISYLNEMEGYSHAALVQKMNAHLDDVIFLSGGDHSRESADQLFRAAPSIHKEIANLRLSQIH